MTFDTSHKSNDAVRAVEAAGLRDQITVHNGGSEELELPEKVDVVVQDARRRDRYCRRKELMGNVRKPRENLCASAFHPSETRKTRTQSGRRSRPLLVPFFEFWRGGTRSRIVFLEVSARWPLILSDDNRFFFLVLFSLPPNIF